VRRFQFELLSHYGKEHYCTLSLVRVFGISMVDEYEIEASFVEHGTQAHIIPHPAGTFGLVGPPILD
jgi:hypothetical protein